MLEISVMIFLS